MNQSKQYKDFITNGGVVTKIQTKPNPPIRVKNNINTASKQGERDMESKQTQSNKGKHL